MKNGLIIGKGWIGSRLERVLQDEYNLQTTKRHSDADNCIAVDFDQPISPFVNIEAFDFVVITVPFGRRNTLAQLTTRFQHIIQFIGPKYDGQIILISSTGIYPDVNRAVTEETFLTQELNEPYHSIEHLVREHLKQVTILRLGGIMGDDRYLSKYLNLEREGLDEVVNHIHYEDILTVIKMCIENNVRGEIINVVAPIHPTKREVLTYQLHDEVIHSITKKGKTIASEKLIRTLNYQFIHPNPLYFKD